MPPSSQPGTGWDSHQSGGSSRGSMSVIWVPSFTRLPGIWLSSTLCQKMPLLTDYRWLTQPRQSLSHTVLLSWWHRSARSRDTEARREYVTTWSTPTGEPLWTLTTGGWLLTTLTASLHRELPSPATPCPLLGSSPAPCTKTRDSTTTLWRSFWWPGVNSLTMTSPWQPRPRTRGVARLPSVVTEDWRPSTPTVCL